MTFLNETHGRQGLNHILIIKTFTRSSDVCFTGELSPEHEGGPSRGRRRKGPDIGYKSNTNEDDDNGNSDSIKYRDPVVETRGTEVNESVHTHTTTRYS